MNRHKREKDEPIEIPYIGPLIPANILGWVVVLLLGANLLLLTYFLGGTRLDKMVISAVCTGLMVFFHGLQWLLMQERDRQLNPLALLMIPALLYIGLHWAFLSPTYWGAKADFVLALQAFSIFWVIIHSVRHYNQLWFVFIVIVGSCGISMLKGYHQFFVKPEAAQMGLTLAEEHVGFATGTFAFPSGFAVLMLMGLCTVLAGGLTRRLTPVLRLFCLYVGGMFFIGVVLSLQQVAITAAVAAVFLSPFVFAGTIKGRVRSFAILLLMAMIIAGSIWGLHTYLTERLDPLFTDQTRELRDEVLPAALAIFGNHPIVGSGGGSFPNEFAQAADQPLVTTTQNPQNTYLGVLAEYGILGFVLFFAPLVWIYVQGVRRWSQFELAPPASRRRRHRGVRLTPARKLFLAGAGLTLLAVALQLFVDDTLRTPVLILMLAVYLGVMAKYAVDQKLITITFDKPLGILACVLGLLLAYFGGMYYYAMGSHQHGREYLQSFSENFSLLRNDAEFIEDATETLGIAAELQPSNADILADNARIYAYATYVNPDQIETLAKTGENYIQQAIAIAPDQYDYHITKGLLLWAQNRLDEAGESFEEAVTLAPNSPVALYYKAAWLNTRKGRYEEALETLEEALSLNPDMENAKALHRLFMMPGAATTQVTEAVLPRIEAMPRARLNRTGLYRFDLYYRGFHPMLDMNPEEIRGE